MAIFSSSLSKSQTTQYCFFWGSKKSSRLRRLVIFSWISTMSPMVYPLYSLAPFPSSDEGEAPVLEASGASTLPVRR
jgi:hypothetical protein